MEHRARARRRIAIAAPMGAVAVAAIAVALLRPLLLPVHSLAAGEVLDQYGPKVHPDLDGKNDRADWVRKTPSGYWRVRFVRVEGDGPPYKDVLTCCPASSRRAPRFINPDARWTKAPQVLIPRRSQRRMFVRSSALTI